MQPGKFNIVCDSQHGSTGKGLIATALASHYNVHYTSTTNLPNAGHTAIISHPETGEEFKFVSKIIPASCILNKFNNSMKAYIGPGAGFTISQLHSEIESCGLSRDQVRVHPRAMVVTEKHKNAERGESGTKHIASTMQGSGAVQAEKLMRGPDCKLARDYPEIREIATIDDNFVMDIHQVIKDGATWLHEGSQGFSLGINHGSHYPQSTSRECTVMQAMSDMGVPPRMVGDIYLVIRPYPIRVGNIVENGEVVGYSGDGYDDHHEISWEDVAAAAGAPPSVMSGELTTVTKRLRRVFTFSEKQLKLATMINGATKIALNFANYIDWKCFKAPSAEQLTSKVWDFIKKVEDISGVPVSMVGTGPNSITDVIYR